MNSLVFLPKKGSKNQILLLLYQMRPEQWVKNVLIFAAPTFSLKIIDYMVIIKSIEGFFLFCFVSGCVYILNDFVDREADRNHPVKRYRPIASGLLNPYIALSAGAVILVASIYFSYYLGHLFSLLLSIYFIMNITYSFLLKNVVIMDVMTIAAGFVLRAIGGGLIVNVHFTPWFLICTMLLALFLAISKRRHELSLLQDNQVSYRKVLDKYSLQLLDQMNTIVATAAIISYALFTFNSGHSIYLMLTIPFVVYGIFRYLYLIHMEEKGSNPEKIIFEDKHILVTVLLYAISVIAILLYLG